MIFKPLHFCFLAVLFVMSLGVSAHLAFTGHSFSLAVALASWSVFLVASMFVAVNAVVQYWFTTGTELAPHCSDGPPPQPRTLSEEIKLIGAHAVADVIREQAGRMMPWSTLDTCASETAQAMRKALQGYQHNCSADTSALRAALEEAEAALEVATSATKNKPHGGEMPWGLGSRSSREL